MARTKIGGITIELSADTTDLTKKLDAVNKESKKTTAELKNIDSALKKAPDSLVLWQQKQEALTKAVENSKKKLDALVSEQENFEKGFKVGKISEEQYKAFQREIEATKGEIEEAEKKLKDFTEAEDKAGAAAKTAGDDIKDSAAKAEGSASGYTVLKDTVAQLAADGFERLLTSAKEAWTEIDEGYDTIIKKTGATGTEFEKLQKAADNVYKSLPVSMADTGAAIGEVNTRFEAVDKELETLTEHFLKYSSINDTQVASSIRNIAGIMQAFQEDTKNTGKVLDTLTEVSQHTGKDVGGLESELLSNAATFKEMGLDIRQSAELLGQFEKNGIDTSTALSGLKKAQQNATAEGKNMTEALAETLDRIKNAKTETEALQTATELFGNKGSAALTQAVREQRFSIDDLTAGFDGMKEVVNDTFEATLDAPDKAEIAFNDLKLHLAALAEQVLPKVDKFVDKGVQELPKIEKTVEEIAPLVKDVGIAYATWKVATTAADGVKALKKFTDEMKAAETGAKGLSAALDTGVLAIVSLIAAGLIDLGKEIKEAHDSYVPTAQRISDKVKAAFEEQEKAIDDVNTSIENLNGSFEAAAEAADTEAVQAYDLWNELDKLADSSGKVKDADKKRAEYILGELNSALGTEYTMTGDQIENYKTLASEIDNVIEKKRAAAYIDAFQANSGEMAKNKNTVREEYLKAASEEQAAIEEFNALSMERYGKILTPEELHKILNDKYTDHSVWNTQDIRLAELAGTNDKTGDDGLGIIQRAGQNREALQAQYNETIDYFNRLDKAQEDFESGQYKSVEKTLYTQKDADREALKSVKEKNDASLKLYEDNLRKVQAAFKLARETNGKLTDSEMKDTIKMFTETADVGLKVIGEHADEIFTKEVRKDIQDMIDKGFDISELAKWCKENSIDVGTVFIDNFDDVVQKQLDAGFDVYDLLIWGGVYGGEFGDKFDAEMINKISEQFKNFDDAGYRDWCAQHGIEAGDVYGRNFAEQAERYLWSLRINRYSINSESDAKHWKDYFNEHKDDPNDEAVQYFRNLGWYATGGFIPANSAGVVAEAGPELLELVNGGVKVTPLSKTATNTPVEADRTVNTTINNYKNTVYATVKDKYDVYAIAEDLATAQRRIEQGKGR